MNNEKLHITPYSIAAENNAGNGVISLFSNINLLPSDISLAGIIIISIINVVIISLLGLIIIIR